MSDVKGEEFADWMRLEAKASREGLSVEPHIEGVALFVDATIRKLCNDLMRLADEGGRA